MSAGIELQPNDLEAIQSEVEGPEPAVRVELAKTSVPIRTQELPHKSGGTRTVSPVGVTAQRILTADHRRATVRLISIGQNMLVAFNMASAADPSRMALWPANVAFTYTADTEVWVASATGTTSISVITEFWANGE